ncbi:MAG: hypothetical protein ACRDHM_06805 [Actinomycetota bacterium]
MSVITHSRLSLRVAASFIILGLLVNAAPAGGSSNDLMHLAAAAQEQASDLSGPAATRLASVQSTVDGATGRADELRAVAATGSVAGMLSTVGGEGSSSIAAPKPLTSVLEQPLAASLFSGAVSELAATVRTSIRSLQPIQPEDLARAADVAQVLVSSQYRERAGQPVVRSTLPEGADLLSGTSAGTAHPSAHTRRIRAEQLQLPESPQRLTRRTRAVAISLGRSIDHLLAAAPATPERAASSPLVDGCDVRDELPYLCIGSEANNEYAEDAALLIDLGGNDVYRNGAGAAPFLPPGDSDYIGVSVNIDLAGNDTYIASTESRPPEGTNPFAVQGAAFGGGVGILVDQAGDDTYTAHTGAGSKNDIRWGVAQGAGFGGTGALFDRAGSDHYSLTGDDGENDWIFLIGQGAATNSPDGAGIGVLIDQSTGDDDYLLDAGDVAQSDWDPDRLPVARAVLGQGAAWLSSAAVLHDEGGNDGFTASASSRSLGVDRYPDPGFGAFPIYFLFGAVGGSRQAPSALAYAQGWASLSGSTAMLITGDGDTTYEIDASSVGMASSDAQGQGRAIRSTAFALLHDRAGNDSYSATASLEHDVEMTVGDSCREAGGKPCSGAQALVTAGRDGDLVTHVAAQGAGFYGQALLVDLNGNDRFEARSLERLDVLLQDELTSPSGPPVLEVVSYPPAAVHAQGAANALAGDAGILYNLRGADTYKIESRNETNAEARSLHADGDPIVGALGEWMAFTVGQGASFAPPVNELGTGMAAMVDIGLQNDTDRFSASGSNPVSTLPDPAGALRLGFYRPNVQGSKAGLFVALGTWPSLVSSPSVPVCLGIRGFQGSWAESFGACAYTAGPADPARDVQSENSAGGVGYISGQPVPISPQFAFAQEGPKGLPKKEWTLDTPAGIRSLPRGVFSAVLKDHQEKPLAGELVHFFLQYTDAPLVQGLPARWQNAVMVDAVTDQSGTATALVPYGNIGTGIRVFATYDGRGHASSEGVLGVHPAHIAQDIVLENAEANAYPE